MIQICFSVFLHFLEIMDMTAPISPYSCTASGQLQKKKGLKIWVI